MPQLLKYDLGPRVTAFSTRRQGGVSEGSYASFNINHYCGDEAEDIARNRQMLCRQLQIDEQKLVYPHQTHGTQMFCVTDNFFSLPEAERKEKLEGIDAVATNLPGVCIGVSTADCIPILLYDSRQHVGAAIHAGWRGTVARIAEQTVRRLTEVYGSEPSDLRAVIGPGISLRSFEVGDEVWQAFSDAGFDMTAISRRFPVTCSAKVVLTQCLPAATVADEVSPAEKWHIDLPGCNRRQLLRAGLPDANITDCAICTYRHYDEFFSARRLGIRSGRIFTAIMLQP